MLYVIDKMCNGHHFLLEIIRRINWIIRFLISEYSFIYLFIYKNEMIRLIAMICDQVKYIYIYIYIYILWGQHCVNKLWWARLLIN